MPAPPRAPVLVCADYRLTGARVGSDIADERGINSRREAIEGFCRDIGHRRMLYAGFFDRNDDLCPRILSEQTGGNDGKGQSDFLSGHE